MRFDGTISLGHVLQGLVMLGAMGIWLYTYAGHEATQDAKIADLVKITDRQVILVDELREANRKQDVAIAEIASTMGALGAQLNQTNSLLANIYGRLGATTK